MIVKSVIKSVEAIGYLEKMLKRAGYNFSNPNPRLAWDVFKEFFSKTEVRCTEDTLFFECGVFGFTGEDLFYLEFVRQFSLNDDEGEYDHREQLQFTIFFKPCEELEKLKMNKWSFDFNSFDEYFEYIESLESFLVPIEQYVPIDSTLHYEVILSRKASNNSRQ
ncbi:MAG TPA: hypothetical protein VIM51_15590 [Desulfosporosinus sp.]